MKRSQIIGVVLLTLALAALSFFFATMIDVSDNPSAVQAYFVCAMFASGFSAIMIPVAALFIGFEQYCNAREREELERRKRIHERKPNVHPVGQSAPDQT